MGEEIFALIVASVLAVSVFAISCAALAVWRSCGACS